MMIFSLIVNIVNNSIYSDNAIKLYVYLGIVILIFILSFGYTIIFNKSINLKKKSHSILISLLLFLIAISMIMLYEYILI